MKRDRQILCFAVTQGCLWMVVLLDHFSDMKDVGWLIPMAGIFSSISLCLMLYLRFRAKGAETR